jgi:DNA gyrase/topoisomerase IV subunit B
MGDGSSPDDGIYILLKEVLDNCIDNSLWVPVKLSGDYQ